MRKPRSTTIFPSLLAIACLRSQNYNMFQNRGFERGGTEGMGIPTGIGIVDTMIGFPAADMKEQYRFITSRTKDAQSRDEFDFPVEYMFKGVPDKKKLTDSSDPVAITLSEMDRWGIEKALVGVEGGAGAQAVRKHPDRFIPSTGVDP